MVYSVLDTIRLSGPSDSFRARLLGWTSRLCVFSPGKQPILIIIMTQVPYSSFKENQAFILGYPRLHDVLHRRALQRLVLLRARTMELLQVPQGAEPRAVLVLPRANKQQLVVLVAVPPHRRTSPQEVRVI